MLAHVGGGSDPAPVERRHRERVGKALRERDLGVDTEPAQDQMVGLCDRQRRRDELAVPLSSVKAARSWSEPAASAAL